MNNDLQLNGASQRKPNQGYLTAQQKESDEGWFLKVERIAGTFADLPILTIDEKITVIRDVIFNDLFRANG